MHSTAVHGHSFLELSPKFWAGDLRMLGDDFVSSNFVVDWLLVEDETELNTATEASAMVYTTS